MPANGGALQVSKVSKGDSFFFGQGNYHWWMNLGTEQLLTVGVFADAAPPDAALMAYDDGAGLVQQFMSMGQWSLLEELVGKSDGHEDAIVYDSPLFPKFRSDYCEQARSKMQNYAYTANSWQVAKPHLYNSQELMSGKFDIMNSAVNGPGGGLFPIAGMVLEGMPQVTGTAETGYNGGISPAMPPAEALWPGFTNVAGGKSLVKFVVGYCGMVAIHTHANAAEWNTVINGEGTVSYFPVNGGSLVTMYVKKGDTFVFPQGSAHWWVNYSPTEQLATVGGFTAPFPDAAPLADFLDESKKVNNLLTDAVLGQNYRSAIELQEMNGADTLFPLLSTRYPSTCGGNTPCQKCN
jgi:oxalate decarboxylase/phosphoglucose isomerase-like protein (cupin superfamily)